MPNTNTPIWLPDLIEYTTPRLLLLVNLINKIKVILIPTFIVHTSPSYSMDLKDDTYLQISFRLYGNCIDIAKASSPHIEDPDFTVNILVNNKKLTLLKLIDSNVVPLREKWIELTYAEIK